jgi:DNA-binding response OmpR family regulator
MNNRKILVVDDEKKLLGLVRAYLEKDGYQVFEATDGDAAIELFRKCSPDLMILDIMMPGIDGLEVCKRVRESSNIPIIMLSAKVEEVDRIVGLEIGADDYVTKPFSPKELVARVRAALRRSESSGSERRVAGAGPLSINLSRRTVEVEGVEVKLTPIEFAILAAMAEKPGWTFSREQLLSRAQGEYYESYEKTVNTHVKNIRKKLKERADGWEFIETIHGVGYRFNARETA